MSTETSVVEPAAAPAEAAEEQKAVVAPTEPTASVTTPIPEPEKAAPVSATTPLEKLFQELPAILKEADHNEIWGVTLADASHIPTNIVLAKFLRANNKDVPKAKAQLIEALKWRKHMDPAKLLEAEYDAAKFGDLGYVTTYQGKDQKTKEIITWNIYGAVKDIKATFGDVNEYPSPLLPSTSRPASIPQPQISPTYKNNTVTNSHLSKIHPLAQRLNGAVCPRTRPILSYRADP
jgi:phosphatidylinositol transfer protein SFH5